MSRIPVPIDQKDLEIQFSSDNHKTQTFNTVQKVNSHTKLQSDSDEMSNKNFKPIPKNIIFLTLFLLICGIAFFIAGMQQYFQDDKTRGIAFIVLGCLMIIPGAYYSVQLCQACNARTPEEREEIMSEIPMD